jgi:hypothetical protein
MYDYVRVTEWCLRLSFLAGTLSVGFAPLHAP